jgi:hypothetical protein
VNQQISRFAGCLAALALLSGCGSKAKPGATAPTITATATKAEPGVVELSSPKVTRGENNRINFEISYKFTSGAPVKIYQLEMSFPGTNERGFKQMESWELKPEGVIKTAVEVGDPTVSKFRIVLSEADSPDRGFTRNSNELTGELEPLAPKTPSS